MQLALIGGGHAAGRLAAALLELDYQGQIAIYGDEPIAPYERPPLSKRDLLSDGDTFGSPALKDAHIADKRLSLHLGNAVTAVNLVEKTLQLGGGAKAHFDRCVFATGVRPRPLDLPEWVSPADIFYLRTANDAAILRDRLKPGVRVCVIGGGFVGLEVGNTAQRRGCDVTVIERANRLIPRLLSPAASAALLPRVEAEGISVKVSASLTDEGAADDRGYQCLLADGATLAADIFVIGIGSIPNDMLARAAGVACDNGILVDQALRTSRTGCYALGDVASVSSNGAVRRIESWDNAQRHALRLAHELCGLAHTDDAPDWFWSDVGDTNLQVIGRIEQSADMAVRRADDARMSIYHVVDERLVGAELFNMGGDRRPIEKLITTGVRVDRHQLTDPTVRMRSLVS